MKKLILFIVTVAIASSVFAQVEVTPGSTRIFTVNQANTVALNATTPYTWDVTGDGAISNTEGTTPNTRSVTFSTNNGDLATITVYATSDVNCHGNLRTVNLVVKPLTYTATYANAAQDLCPASSAVLTQTGVAVPIVVNFNNDVTSFIYAINGVSQPSVNVASTNTATINLATVFTNTEVGANTVEIVSITGTLGTSLQDNGSTVHTINVSEAPVINDIF